MSQRFRPCSLDQTYLMPPSVHDWLPENHMARLLADVVSELDLSAILGDYGRKDNRGLTAYHPEMMTRLLLYAYCTNQPSSRKIEQGTYTDIPLRYLAANQHPDHDTIAEFRRRHLPALAALFVQVLALCREAGLVRLGHVAIDGTKVKANANSHQSYTLDELLELEKGWQQTVDKLLHQAEQADQADGRNSDPPLPSDLAKAETRLAAIRAAQQTIKDRAQQRLERAEAAAAKLKRKSKREQLTAGERSRRAQVKETLKRARRQVKKPTSSYNFVDPDSRIMRDGATGGFVQSYNAQIAVDDSHQVIVAHEVSQDGTDHHLLAPMIAQMETHLGQRADCITADTGYFDTAEIELLQTTGHNLLIPPERIKPGPLPANATRNTVADAMRERLKLDAEKKQYDRRSCTVEPVFGYTKEQRNYRRFALRGHENVRGEWALISITHNLRKLFRYRDCPIAA